MSQGTLLMNNSIQYTKKNNGGKIFDKVEINFFAAENYSIIMGNFIRISANCLMNYNQLGN